MHGGSGSFGATFRRLLNSIPVDVSIVDGNGNQITSFGGTGGTSSSFGSSFPATGTAAGALDISGNMAALNLDASGNLKVTGTGGGGGGAVTIADGADVAEGATTDVAVVGDNSGTVSAKLRGLSKLFNDVWDSANHWLKVSIQNATLAVTQSGGWSVGQSGAPWTQRIQDGAGATLATVTAGNALKVDGSAVIQQVSQNGTWTTTRKGAGTSALTNVAASASSVTVLATNANRLQAMLYNDSSSDCYVKLGAVASTSSFTKRLLPNEYFDVLVWVGQIDVIWTSAAGNMRVTELTA